MSLKGSLKTVALPEALQFLAATGKTGELHVMGDTGEGRLWFRDGRLSGFEVGKSVELSDAVFELMRFDDGEFSFAAGDDTVDRGEPTDVESVVERASAQLAEWVGITSVVPSLDHGVRLVEDVPGDQVVLSRSQWELVVAIGRGQRVGDLIEERQMTDFVGCRAVRDLVGISVAEIVEPGVVAVADRPDAEPAEHTPQSSPDSGDADAVLDLPAFEDPAPAEELALSEPSGDWVDEAVSSDGPVPDQTDPIFSESGPAPADTEAGFVGGDSVALDGETVPLESDTAGADPVFSLAADLDPFAGDPLFDQPAGVIADLPGDDDHDRAPAPALLGENPVDENPVDENPVEEHPTDETAVTTPQAASTAADRYAALRAAMVELSEDLVPAEGEFHSETGDQEAGYGGDHPLEPSLGAYERPERVAGSTPEDGRNALRALLTEVTAQGYDPDLVGPDRSGEVVDGLADRGPWTEGELAHIHDSGDWNDSEATSGDEHAAADEEPTQEERPADEPINRGLLLKFLSSVRN